MKEAKACLARLPKSKAEADKVDVVRRQIVKDVASLRRRHAIDQTGSRAVAAAAAARTKGEEGKGGFSVEL